MLQRLHALAACSVLALLAACGGGPDVPGTYAFDSDASLEHTDLGEEQERLGPTLSKIFGGIESEMTLAGDHTYEMWIANDATGSREESKGTWSREGDQLTIRQTEANGVEKEQTNVMTLVDGALTMTEDGMGGATMTLVYRRK